MNTTSLKEKLRGVIIHLSLLSLSNPYSVKTIHRFFDHSSSTAI